MKKTTISLLSLLLLTHFNTQSMIVGSSCLKRSIGKINNKLVILYDKHAFDTSDAIKTGHNDDMLELINTTSQSQKTVPFLLEISEAHKDPVRLQNMVLSPGNIAIKTALNNNMKYKNINFISFDNRTNHDFLMRDMLLQTDEFVQAIKQNYKFPSDFYNITAQNFLQHIATRHNANTNAIDNLAADQNVKNQYKTLNKQKYEDCHKKISTLLKTYNVDDKRHLINLITRLDNIEKKQLFIALLEENCFAVDMNLLEKTLTLSEKHPLSIINAGSYHSHNIEQRILSHFPGFKKDVSSSMSLPDLKLDSLCTIQYPTHVPNHFMNNNTKSFISNSIRE